jgi:hypothetical protein
MSKVVEASKWSALSIVMATLFTPVLLIWVVLFMVYRLLTWPFRLVRGWLRVPKNPRSAKGS